MRAVSDQMHKPPYVLVLPNVRIMTYLLYSLTTQSIQRERTSLAVSVAETTALPLYCPHSIVCDNDSLFSDMAVHSSSSPSISKMTRQCGVCAYELGAQKWKHRSCRRADKVQ